MRISILTTFRNLNSGYSLCSVVYYQCRMLERMGHQVDLLVNETFEDTYPAPPNVNIRRCIPDMPQKDYNKTQDLTEEHKQYIDKLAPILVDILKDYDVCLTQDIVYIGWHMPHALALQKVSPQTQHCLFLHFINSVPPRCAKNTTYDWWDINKYTPNHKLVSFTEHNKKLIMDWYLANEDQVVVIPHSRDPRIENNFCQETWDLIDDMPNILQGDIVCVYPASTDRLNPKQVHIVLGLFDAFKRRNMRCALVIANQWATGRCPKENIEKYKNLGIGLGLRYGEEFLFTSEWRAPKYETGISREMLSNLRKCANFFPFPTIEEAYGLVGLEAALDGQYLVMNSDVGCFKEIYGESAHYEAFGAIEQNSVKGMTYEQVVVYLDDMSQRILEGMKKDKTCMAKTHIRCQNNMDKIYFIYEDIFTKWQTHGV